MLARRPGPTTRLKVTEVTSGRSRVHEDRVATEEPLEIRLTAPGLPATRLGVLMRTPGHDFELAAGWLVHERIATAAAIRQVRYCTDADLRAEQEFNVVTIELATPPLSLPAARLVGSACGVCGADTVDETLSGLAPVPPVSIEPAVAAGLAEQLHERQGGYAVTGGSHAAGLATSAGELVVVREDVGRHNAVDKVVGARLLAGQDVAPVLVLSGRIAFELVQKAAVSRIGALVAVGAPTSLAVTLARRAGITLVGFTRPERCVVYTSA